MKETDKRNLEAWIARALADPEYLDTLPDEKLEALAECMRNAPATEEFRQRKAKAREAIMREVNRSIADGQQQTAEEGSREAELAPVRMIALALIVHAIRRKNRDTSRSSTEVAGGSEVEGDQWDLVGEAGEGEFLLPPDIAEHSYGLSQQSISLRLVRVSREGGQYEPQLQLFPGPVSAPLVISLTLVDGEQRTLTIPTAPSAGRWVWSRPCDELLPPGSFGTDDWSLQLEIAKGQP